MASGKQLNKFDGISLNDPTMYRSVVGTLQYCTIARPEIAFSVNKLFQFMVAPSDVHWLVVKHVLRYLKGSMSHDLHLYKCVSLGLTAFLNVD